MSDISVFMDRFAAKMEDLKSLNQGIERYISNIDPPLLLTEPQSAHITTLHNVSKVIMESLEALGNVAIMLDEEMRKSKISTR